MKESNALQIFSYENNELRTMIGEDGEIWFVGSDVCGILGIKNVSDAVEKLGDNEKLLSPWTIAGQQRNVLCINEPGFYRLIFRSDKPDAEKIQYWVFHDVLPAIRKTGSYSLRQSSQEVIDIDVLQQKAEEHAQQKLFNHYQEKIYRQMIRQLQRRASQPQKKLLTFPGKEPIKMLPKPEPTIEEAVLQVLATRLQPGEMATARQIAQWGNTQLRHTGSPRVRVVLNLLCVHDMVTCEGQGRSTLYGLPE